MNVELDEIDIINMLEGTCCPFDFVNEFSKKYYGTFIGGFSDEWKWDREILIGESEEKLMNIYNKIKRHWIDAGMWE